MKFFSLFMFIFMLTSSFALSQTQTQPKAEAEAKRKTGDSADKKAGRETDEFGGLVREYYAAWNTLDVNNPARYYAKDTDLIFFDVLPLQYKSWKEYHAGASSFLQKFSAFRLVPNRDLITTRRGKIAWTTVTFHLSAKQKDGAPMELDGRHTAIWEKRKGKWLIVHEHISTPLPQ